MASVLSYLIVDQLGAPVTGATPQFLAYKWFNGTGISSPTIVNLSGGLYCFQPATVDKQNGTVFLIDNGSDNSPRFVAGTEMNDDQPIFAWHLVDETGSLFTGSAPQFARYVDSTGSSLLPFPTITAFLGSSLWAFKPSSADYSASVAFRIDNPTGSYPSFIAGGVEQVNNVGVVDMIPPVVSNIIPPVSTVISSSQVISLDITDNLWLLADILVMCRFFGTTLYEVVHDGNDFGPMYATSVKTSISGGYNFQVLRTGGWPASPSIFAAAIDRTGNINA